MRWLILAPNSGSFHIAIGRTLSGVDSQLIDAHVDARLVKRRTNRRYLVFGNIVDLHVTPRPLFLNPSQAPSAVDNTFTNFRFLDMQRQPVLNEKSLEVGVWRECPRLAVGSPGR